MVAPSRDTADVTGGAEHALVLLLQTGPGEPRISNELARDTNIKQQYQGHLTGLLPRLLIQQHSKQTLHDAVETMVGADHVLRGMLNTADKRLRRSRMRWVWSSWASKESSVKEDIQRIRVMEAVALHGLRSENSTNEWLPTSTLERGCPLGAPLRQHRT